MRWFMITAAAVALLVSAGSALAAVSLCEAPVSGGPQRGASEAAAKTAALAAWVREASRLYGARYTSWRLAQHKTLACEGSGSGASHVCEACARPCTIEQVPVPGARPLQRLDPLKRSAEGEPAKGCPPRKGINA